MSSQFGHSMFKAEHSGNYMPYLMHLVYVIAETGAFIQTCRRIKCLYHFIHTYIYSYYICSAKYIIFQI